MRQSSSGMSARKTLLESRVRALGLPFQLLQLHIPEKPALVRSISQLRHESRQLILRPDPFPGRQSGMESHVLEGDHGSGPRETEAPYSSPTSSFPEAQCEQRSEQLSALTPTPPQGRAAGRREAAEAWGSWAGAGGPVFPSFWGSGLVFKFTPNCPERLLLSFGG